MPAIDLWRFALPWFFVSNVRTAELVGCAAELSAAPMLTSSDAGPPAAPVLGHCLNWARGHALPVLGSPQLVRSRSQLLSVQFHCPQYPGIEPCIPANAPSPARNMPHSLSCRRAAVVPCLSAVVSDSKDSDHLSQNLSVPALVLWAPPDGSTPADSCRSANVVLVWCQALSQPQA